MTALEPKLFRSNRVGRMPLQHRVVLAPMGRLRATNAGVPIVPLVAEYYKQRGSSPGTLLITEGTLIAPDGADHVPGIWSKDQIDAWKKVTDTVHAQGSFIVIQIVALGRGANPEALQANDPPLPYVAPSDIPPSHITDVKPRPLTVPEIQEYVRLFRQAASNAVHRAGFDGVELHAANGWLVDQFFQDVTNTRTDGYGHGVDGRSRFALEVLEAISDEVGADRTAVRLSPWSRSLGMRMEDPKPTFAYFVSQLKERLPDLAYLHVVEPRVHSTETVEVLDDNEENDFLRAIWAPRPFIRAGAFTRESALEAAEQFGDLIAVGRYYVSNPDLPNRWRASLPLTPYDRSTFYLAGNTTSRGYTDYPFAK